ncbi:MAG: DLW-39 family protein [Micrococcales bacterium]|nr:DLW-39 family protein [Micrococcales bacterium]
MKKVLIILAVLAVGVLAYRKYAKDQAELDLWAEVTDPVA